MREEDISMINIVKNKEIGDVEFFRYFLSIGDLEKKKIPTAIFQAYECFKALNQDQDLDYLYASADPLAEKILITGKSSSEIIVNFVFDFTANGKESIKQVEIVGSDGMYQFDTTSEIAFYSDMLDNQIKYDFEAPDEAAQQFFDKVQTSISENQKVLLGGGK